VWLIKDGSDYLKLILYIADPDKWDHPIDLGAFPVSAYMSDSDIGSNVTKFDFSDTKGAHEYLEARLL
jgi:hypothetical protein